MTDIHIDTVKNKKDLKRFIHFPWKVYKDDPNWVPPLIMDIKEKLDRRKDPFFEHAEMELFLAFRGDRITGRIAAIVDDNHNRTHEDKTAFFGMYESLDDPETAAALIEQAGEWARARGMDNLRGPANLSLNDECAFLLEGFDSPPMVMMPYNPPYYHDLMEKCGMVKAKDLYAFRIFQHSKARKDVQAIVDETVRNHSITLRTLDFSNLDAEGEKIKYVYNNAWKKNWGFVPWTEHEMDHMVRKLKQVADPRLVIIAEDKDRPVGFAFALPNWNEVLIKLNGRLFPFGIFKFMFYKKRIKGVRALVFGILGEYQKTGLSYMLFDKFLNSALDSGYTWGETSWQLEDNEAVNRFVMSIGGEVYKKYRLYEKSI